MSFFQTRLFLRILSKSREVYFLKVITLAIACACSTLIILFSLNEFGYDRFHRDHASIFRVLQRNNSEPYRGNRTSNKISNEVFSSLSAASDSLIVSRVKMLDQVNALAGSTLFNDSRFYAADPNISQIFSFDVLDGSMDEFREKASTVILSSSSSIQYFGTNQSSGKKLKLFTLGDTVLFTVAAVFKDYPQNSHEEFNSFIRFDHTAIRSLSFNPAEAGLYAKLLKGDKVYFENTINRLSPADQLTYTFQPLSEIYFGPRVLGEDAKHGDHYSIVILVCITGLILFLALTSFINLTTLTLPYRSKELAIKKLAGTSQGNLIVDFVKESVLLVGISLTLGILLLVFTSNWIRSILSIDIISLLLQGNFLLIAILMVLFIVIAIAPIFVTLKFTRATPIRLLSTETISFPRFKRTIMVLQLGISIFLIVASMVIKRQINHSLLKEPGRNYDQVIYGGYPKDLTNEGLASLRADLRKTNPNVMDVMATSQLPDAVNSKELSSGFYFMSVDRGYKDFFDLELADGNWFKPNDGDSIVLVNEMGKRALDKHAKNVIGTYRDLGGQFNQPEKPIKLNVAPYFNYNFLCIRVLEVDIRRTVRSLEPLFEKSDQKAKVSFLNKRFEEWLNYQDRLNSLSEILAIISGLLSCCAIYGLSIGIVRDKLKQIAIHKLCGANTFNITRLLVREFTGQLLLAILIFGPFTYIVLSELLRTFVYTTHFNWLDPILPLAYCAVVITLLCVFQTLSLNRENLSSALKG